MLLKKSDFAQLGGKRESGDGERFRQGLSLHDEIAAKDPYFDKRLAAIRASCG